MTARSGEGAGAATGGAGPPADRTRVAAAANEPPLVVGVFEDEVRAEQAARALEVWRGANRAHGVEAIGVVARRVSGGATWRVRGVTRPGRAAVTGLVAGFVLLGLPAAGAAGLAGWALASAVLGLAGLVGVVPAASVGGGVLVATCVAAGFAGALVGLVGAAAGCLVGLVVGLADQQIHGLHRVEVVAAAAALTPGAWAAVARTEPALRQVVQSELVRLGGAPG